jgi:xanthine dehydrogenase molybdenum-binding subunit
MGQGSETVIAQIVAEELGLDVDDIHVIHSDTDICPWDVGAHASRTTFVAGNAARGAARKIKARILELGAKELNTPIEQLVLCGRHIQHRDEPETKLEIGKLLRKAHFNHAGQMLMAEYFYDPANENMGKDFRGNMSMTYAFGTHGVRVQVDEETGKVRILNYVAAHDVGRAINPMLLEGQVYGGVMMGVGYALSEQVILEKGETMNPNFRDYKILTAKDVIPVDAPVLETHDPDGPFGAKGIGEPGCVPTAPAIANAIYDAVGVRITDLPITPERVLAAIREKKGLDLCGRPKGQDEGEACVIET